MALKGYRWDASGSVDHKKKDMFDKLDDYLNSAHRFIEEAEQQIRDEPPTPPEPMQPTPMTSTNRNEKFPRWSYSSLNSAARRKRINGSWEREHCGTTNSLKALLDSLDIPSEDCPDQQESKQDSHTMNIKEIEKMTRDLLEGLDDIEETMPVSDSEPLPLKPLPAVVSAPDASPVLPAQEAQTRKIAPRKHLNRTLSSETGDEFSTFLEELCDQGVASPSWHFVPRRYRSVESLSDSDREDDALQPTRLWTSEENVSNKSSKSLISSRQARVNETPSPVDSPSLENPLDKQNLLVALTKIDAEQNKKVFSPIPPPPLPPVANVRNPKLILSDEDIFAEFEAEFSATLTRKTRKGLGAGRLSNSGSRSEISPKTDSRVLKKPEPAETNPSVSRRPSNVQLRANFFAGMVNGDSTQAAKPPTTSATTETTSAGAGTGKTRAPPIINNGVPTRVDHDLKEKARKKVHLEALNHPLLISYRRAIQKNTAVLQSNPDLSQIISNARGENRKSLIIPSSREGKDQLPHNCRVIPDRRENEKNTRNTANDGNNNEVLDKPPASPLEPDRNVRADDEQCDPYSEEFERSMDSLETFSEKFQLDSISAGFEAELAKLFPSTERSESEEQQRDETATETNNAGPTKESKVSPQKAPNGSFLGHGGRRSDDKSPTISPARKSTNSGKFSPRIKTSVRHQSDALPRLPNTPIGPSNGLRPESPDLATFELNKSEQILAQLVKSSTDPAVAKLLLGDETSKIENSTPKPLPRHAAFCPCGKLLESAEEARSELCKHCSSSKAMRFLQACTNYGNKTNSLPILRGTSQPPSSSEVRLREKPVRPSKQKRSCRIEFPMTNGCSETSFSSNSSTSFTSAPITRNGPHSSNYILRSNSATDLHEAEAIQALEWLRDTGFPQYAQQFEDNMFPLDMSTVQRDHERLGDDEMQSLIRRLECLNKCASMRAETKAKVAHHCSDEDLALSENWQFHRPSRRWSRIATNDLPLITKQDVDEENREDAIKPEPYSSHDSVFLTPNNRSPDSESHHPASLVANSSLSVSDERLQEQPNRSPTPSNQQTKLRRSGSERIRDAIVRKVDSFRRRRREARSKSPRSLRGNQSGLVGQGSPKFLSPKGKRRECYDNQGLQGDSDVGDLESLSPIINNESVVAEGNGEPRRDSGVGSCVTRTSVCSTGGSGLLAATKWHCYPGTPVHTLALTSNELVPLWRLTASDHMLLRKHALLRLTAIMERHCPPYKTGWTWTVPKFIKKMTTPSYKDKVLFGIPLMINIQRGGQPIPPCIQFAMQYIASKAPSCYGIFRKPGLKSRIDNLRAIHEQRVMNPSIAMYENQILFDIADMLKQYFREIPDGGLLTTKLAPTFRYIFMHIPEEYRLEAVQCLVTIMPDENREALEALLCFLAELSQYGAANGMTASNLATCFAPSIFQSTQNFSPKRGRRDSTNGDREINENIASNDCLLKMIEWHEELFCASEQTLHSLRIVVEEPSDIRNYLTDNGQPLYKLNFEVSLNWLLHEVRNSKGWTQISHPNLELACKRIEDDFHYVRLWKISVQVPASPTRILNRILSERALWDFSLVKQIFVCKLDPEAEVCGIIQTEMGKNARRQYLLLRAWKTNITTKGACALIEVSVSDPLLSGNIDPDPEHCHTSTPWVRAHVLASRYLIQPTGNGRSKVTHLARVEPMGRNGYWHSRSAGFVYALQLHNLAQSFETTVSTESIPSSSGSSATLAANRESVV